MIAGLTAVDGATVINDKYELLAFGAKIAEAYFRQTRAALKEVAPRQLYLGCRFAEVNPLVAAIAAKHADVVSFNVYKRSPAETDFAGLTDVPLLIGEFHFGALAGRKKGALPWTIS